MAVRFSSQFDSSIGLHVRTRYRMGLTLRLPYAKLQARALTEPVGRLFPQASFRTV